MEKQAIYTFSKLPDRKPTHVEVENIDLVLIRYDDHISLLYGRCLHRGALLADGYIEGPNLICGLHGWDYRYDTGVSEYNNEEHLHKFAAHIENDQVMVDIHEIKAFKLDHPQPFRREEYLGTYADTHPEPQEPYSLRIKDMAQHGLSQTGHHGASTAMGVDRTTLPQWEDIQILPAQLHRRPLEDDAPVATETVIGPRAVNPLKLDIPVFVSDMSLGALSREAKIALAKGAEMAGTAICSGEGGMLPEEQQNNSRYCYEMASAKFGFSWEKVQKAQAFHFKAGQGAKTGVGGHLPGEKVAGEIADVRGLTPGKDAISPAAFADLITARDYAEFSNEVRERTGGIPVGFKIAASHIEKDIDFALEAGTDYIILDGRGGGTGAAPVILRDNINVPTIPALAQARKHLYRSGITDVTLVITGGLRTPEDFAKAMMLGADAVAVANAAIQAVGCLGMRACNTNNCPVGIATQKPHLRKRLNVDQSAKQLYNFFTATAQLMKVIARACGTDRLSDFNKYDLTTLNREMHRLTGIAYSGVNP